MRIDQAMQTFLQLNLTVSLEIFLNHVTELQIVIFDLPVQVRATIATHLLVLFDDLQQAVVGDTGQSVFYCLELTLESAQGAGMGLRVPHL
jgi:hypothetical protein